MRAGAAIRNAPGKEAAGTSRSELLVNALPGAKGARSGAFSGALLAANAAVPKQPAASPTPAGAESAEPVMLPDEKAPAPLPPPNAPPTQTTTRVAYRTSTLSVEAHGERQKPHADRGSIGAAPEIARDASLPPPPSPALPASSAGATGVVPSTSPALPAPPATFAGPKLIRTPPAANIPQTETKTPAFSSSDKSSLAMTTAASAAPTDQPAVGAPPPTPTPIATLAATPPAGGTAPPTPSHLLPAPPTTAPAPAPPHNPVAQLAPTLVAFATPVSGTQHLTIRLSPPELGAVTIRVERPPEAPPRVEITVQHPQTLALMLRDQPRLHHALDQAGIASDGRSLTFYLDDNGRGGSPGGGSTDDHWSAGGTPEQTTMSDEGPLIPPAWRRAGLDITA
ncbi:MAG: flagellar hook-length control protein FliK [Acetobacteraceae bacterium]